MLFVVYFKQKVIMGTGGRATGCDRCCFCLLVVPVFVFVGSSLIFLYCNPKEIKEKHVVHESILGPSADIQTMKSGSGVVHTRTIHRTEGREGHLFFSPSAFCLLLVVLLL